MVLALLLGYNWCKNCVWCPSKAWVTTTRVKWMFSPCRAQHFFYLAVRKWICVQMGGKSRIACLRVERHAANCASATQSGEMFITPAPTGKMFIPPETCLPAANYALARNATFSTNLDTKRRVYLERYGGDMTRVNTALATLGRIHFTLVTIATMPPLVHNLLLFALHGTIKSTLWPRSRKTTIMILEVKSKVVPCINFLVELKFGLSQRS